MGSGNRDSRALARPSAARIPALPRPGLRGQGAGARRVLRHLPQGPAAKRPERWGVHRRRAGPRQALRRGHLLGGKLSPPGSHQAAAAVLYARAPPPGPRAAARGLPAPPESGAAARLRPVQGRGMHPAGGGPARSLPSSRRPLVAAASRRPGRGSRSRCLVPVKRPGRKRPRGRDARPGLAGPGSDPVRPAGTLPAGSADPPVPVADHLPPAAGRRRCDDRRL